MTIFVLMQHKKDAGTRLEQGMLVSCSLGSARDPMHCQHCKGVFGPCACKLDCVRPSTVRCYGKLPKGFYREQALSFLAEIGAHCRHCRGGEGECGCSVGCSRLVAAKCFSTHCQHCRGKDAMCSCSAKCYRPVGARCYGKSCVYLFFQKDTQ